MDSTQGVRSVHFFCGGSCGSALRLDEGRTTSGPAAVAHLVTCELFSPQDPDLLLEAALIPIHLSQVAGDILTHWEVDPLPRIPEPMVLPSNKIDAGLRE